MKHVLVIGGGAAGMMAAVTAAVGGALVDLYEKNEKTGKKIYITGKGRCNVTNNCEPDDFLNHVCGNPRFMFSSFNGFTNRDAMRFFEEQGCRLKTERGERVFPVSDHSSDVISALNRAMRERGVRVHLNTQVQSLVLMENPETGGKKAVGIRLADGSEVSGDSVIVCTGGLSYESTGSTGDGYAFAGQAGLRVTDTFPSLVPVETVEGDILRMQGLSLKNVSLTLKAGKKTLYDGFGELMFTHFGMTGPLVLTASTVLGKALQKGPVKGWIDLKPALSDEQLRARILREFDQNRNKQFANVPGALVPAKMVPILIERSGIPADKRIHDITKAEREAFFETIRHFEVTIRSLRSFREAVITKGGVGVRQIRPDSMEAKNVPGLYFAGEVLDVDAVTGGFNLQIAWSTGHAAGAAAAGKDGI